ncbi:PTS fructose transporter subunit IIA [Lactobacillus sp. ESL0791]|uniref:PTS sugar transporter subunit IIA n=1 Tax=Lactobacillus sp. ESL0791 TaxID=2983234 RepID=UPI0023F99C49|nr:PTS fructose transporter subunit IIA [Lactobacillus sp. ESL0791]MDF7637850.1 PTS fructose transporter subunit IIA [Lactobacillus sp. ESL0791]
MNKILIATHSTMAEGLYNSCNLLVGNLKNVSFINAYEDEKDWTKQLDIFFSEYDSSKSYIVFTDIYGGSVNQRVTQYKHKYNFLLITGVNLPILLQCLLFTGRISREDILKIIEESRKDISLVELQEVDEENENDFFN